MVLSRIVDKVVKWVDKVTNQRRTSRRESHPANIKAKVSNELLYADKSQYVVAKHFKINQSMVSEWLKNKNTAFEQAATATKKNLLKQRPSRKYLPLYNSLLTTFKEARKKGYHVNFNWLWSRTRVIYWKQQNDENALVKKNVIVYFLKRFNIRMRC